MVQPGTRLQIKWVGQAPALSGTDGGGASGGGSGGVGMNGTAVGSGGQLRWFSAAVRDVRSQTGDVKVNAATCIAAGVMWLVMWRLRAWK